MRPEDHQALTDLISRHVDGLLNETEEAQLTGVLDASAEARAVLASFMRLEGILVLRREVKGALSEGASPAPVARRSRRRVWAAGVAACLAVLAGVAWLL